MKLSLLFLFSVGVLNCRGEHASNEKGNLKEPENVNKRVNMEVLSLIESAVKLAQYSNLDEKLKAVTWVQDRLDNIKETLDAAKEIPTIPPEPEVIFPEDCRALLDGGFTESGLYTIYPRYPESYDPLDVYCDQVSDGGGWIVFQRRKDGSVSFERTWDEYRDGFGDTSGEFWLGNDNLVLLTTPPSGGSVELRVDIVDWANGTAFAQYGTFKVRGSRYTLTAEDYLNSSTAGNPLDYHTGRHFTTIDRDNDRASGGNCAKWMRGGWWFNFCLLADPNGPYLPEHGPYGALSPGKDQGVTWTSYTGHGYEGRHYSLKATEMKLRRASMTSGSL